MKERIIFSIIVCIATFLSCCAITHVSQKGYHSLKPSIENFDAFFKDPNYENSGIICGEFSGHFLATPSDRRIFIESYSLKFVKNSIVQQVHEIYGYNRKSDSGSVDNLFPHNPYFFLIIPSGEYSPNDIFMFNTTYSERRDFTNKPYDQRMYLSPHFLLSNETNIKVGKHEIIYIGKIILKVAFPNSSLENSYSDLISRLPVEKSSELPSLEEIKSKIDSIKQSSQANSKQNFNFYYVDTEDNFKNFSEYTKSIWGQSKYFHSIAVKKTILNPIGLVIMN
jgi:hypothetical protein